MISLFLKEEKMYSQSDLLDKFSQNHENPNKILNKLLSYNIIRKETKNSLYFVEENLSNNLDHYVFKFVGLIIIDEFIIKVYPKYIKSDIENKFKQVLKVIEKIHNKEQKLFLNNNILLDNESNFISLILFFINDYYLNGLYNNINEITEINGLGAIDWDRTINHMIPFTQHNKPYYFDLFTKNKINDENNYFRNLHKFILTDCINRLKKYDLLDVFGFDEINLSSNVLYDFGDEKYILKKIDRELNVEFSTYKRILLKSMYNYVKQISSFNISNNFFTIYGTTAYNLIWEKICGYVLNDIKNEKIYNLELPIKVKDKYPNETLLSIIEKPKWNYLYDNILKNKEKDTFIPDFLMILKSQNDFLFIILDAKYYSINFTKKDLKGQPGIESISKQYFYHLAYKKFIDDVGFNKVKNGFILPYDDSEIINRGYVELDILNNLGLSNIEIIFLPAYTINEYYLNDKKLDLSFLLTRL